MTGPISSLMIRSSSPGLALAGNLGIAVAAALTGLLMQWFGWQAAFAAPGVVCVALGMLFMRVVPRETASPAKRKGGAKGRLSRSQVARALAVMTLASATGGIRFNLTTNGNAQLLTERFRGVMSDPATLGLLRRDFRSASVRVRRLR
jgi:MFS family permease